MADITQNSFTAGELSPILHNRPDLARYATGLKTCRNFFVHPEGGVSNRPGFEYIATVKDTSRKTRVVGFAFSSADTYCIEFGHQYLRFIRNGGQVLLSAPPPAWAVSTAYTAGDHVAQSGINYYCHTSHTSTSSDQPGIGATWANYWYQLTGDIVEIPTTYDEADLMALRFVQSADVMTIVHHNYPPRDLKRYAHDRWVIEDINFGPSIDAPTNVAISGGNGTAAFDYVVTAIGSDTGEESLPSTPVNGLEDLGVLTWDAVAGAESYNIYKAKNGVYGYIGNAIGTTFTDEKILPDLADTPPVSKLPFSSPGDYPSVVAYHEQRLVFANTLNDPQKIWFSQTANFHNFNLSRPQKSGDAITIVIDSDQVNSVQGMVSLNDFIILTSGAEHKITSGDSPFAIENIRVRPQSYRGAEPLRPVLIGGTILFLQAYSMSFRTLGYKLEVDGYKGDDISITAKHLFDGFTFTDITYAKEPYSHIWMLRSDGTLVTLTYIEEQQVIAWHRHDTDGVIESIAAVTESGEDRLYAVVRRTRGSDGLDYRYIERLSVRNVSTPEEGFFVDSGLTYSGAPVTTLSGLDHLAGNTVSILVDGNVHPQKTVDASGNVILDYAASVVHVGLPYTAEMETLEPPVKEVQGRYKRASEIIIGVYRSRGLWVATEAGEYVELKQREDEAWGNPIDLKSGYFRVMVEPSYGTGAIKIRQTDPLPLTVLSVTADYKVED